MILIKYLNNGSSVIELLFLIVHFFKPKVGIQVIVYPHLLFAGNVQFPDGAGPRNPDILLELFIELADHVFEDVFLGQPEINGKRQHHNNVPAQKACQIPHQLGSGGVFIVDLKSCDFVYVCAKKNEGQDSIIETEFAERPGQGSHKGKAVSIGNVTRDVEGGCKTGCEQPHNEKAAEIYFVQILRIEKEIGDTQVFAKAASDHRK
jgi:hypothetical protein